MSRFAKFSDEEVRAFVSWVDACHSESLGDWVPALEHEIADEAVARGLDRPYWDHPVPEMRP